RRRAQSAPRLTSRSYASRLQRLARTRVSIGHRLGSARRSRQCPRVETPSVARGGGLDRGRAARQDDARSIEPRQTASVATEESAWRSDSTSPPFAVPP